MWDDDRASQALGMAIDEIAPGRAVLRMTVRDDMVNGHAIGHGGLTFTLADIHLYGWLHFGNQIGQPLDRGNAHVAAWFDRIAQRPSAKA